MPGRISAFSTTLTRGATSATAPTARFTTSMTSSHSPSIVVNIASVWLGSPLERTTCTARATTPETPSPTPRGVTENATIMTTEIRRIGIWSRPAPFGSRPDLVRRRPQRLSVVPAEVLDVVGPVARQHLCGLALPALVGRDQDEKPPRRELAGVSLPLLGLFAEHVLGEPVEPSQEPVMLTRRFEPSGPVGSAQHEDLLLVEALSNEILDGRGHLTGVVDDGNHPITIRMREKALRELEKGDLVTGIHQDTSR